MSKDKYVIGIDYGTDSVRALILHAGTGEAVSSARIGGSRPFTKTQTEYRNPKENSR